MRRALLWFGLPPLALLGAGGALLATPAGVRLAENLAPRFVPGLVLRGFVERVGDRTPLVAADGTKYLGEVLTVEDLAGPDGALHPIQRAMYQKHGSQCGFCTPGIVMSLVALDQETERLRQDAARGHHRRIVQPGVQQPGGHSLEPVERDRGVHTRGSAGIIERDRERRTHRGELLLGTCHDGIEQSLLAREVVVDRAFLDAD